MAERTHDVGRAFAVVRKSILSIGAFASAFCGCQSGAYKIATSVDENTQRAEVPYYKVDTKATDETAFMKKSMPFEDGGVVYDEDKMPILVVESKAKYSPDKPGWSSALWLFSLGVFPMCYSSYMTQDVVVKTPIGEKTGSLRVDARWWFGWLPIFIGYPCFADERIAQAQLPSSRIEEIGRDRLVEGLVKEFEFKDYVAFAKKQNASRKIELARIATSKTKIEEFVKQKKFAEAETLLAADSKPREGSLEGDSETWDAMKTLIADRKEDFRVANKKADLEKKFAEKQYEVVVAECDRERDSALWSELRAKAKDAILKRDTQLEQKRIEAQKSIVAKLLEEKKYAEVLAVCEKEKKSRKSFMPDNSAVWNQYAKEASGELRKIKMAKIPSLMDAKKYDEVIKLCQKEDGADFAAWRKKASDAKYKQEHLIQFLEDTFNNFESDYREKKHELLDFFMDNAEDKDSKGFVRQAQFLVFTMKKLIRETIAAIEDGILDLAEQPTLDRDGLVAKRFKENVSYLKGEGMLKTLSEMEDTLNAAGCGSLPDLTDKYAYGEFLVDTAPNKLGARKKFTRLHSGEKIWLKKAEVRSVRFNDRSDVEIGLALNDKSIELKTNMPDMILVANSVADGDCLTEICGGLYYDKDPVGASFLVPPITLTNAEFRLDKPMAKLPDFDFKTCSGDELVKMLDSAPKMSDGVRYLIAHALNGRELTFTNVRVDSSLEMMGLSSRTLEIGHKDNKIEFSLVCDSENDVLESIDEGDVVPQISGTWEVKHIRDGVELKRVTLKLRNKTIKL